MKIFNTIMALGAATTLLAGCQGMDTGGLMNAGMTAYKGVSLTDAEVKTMAEGSCEEMDGQSNVAPPNSTYAKRLDKIAKALGNNAEGQTLNYKVYETPEVNAWAMPNGCVRVYSGLMDAMTDNEVEGVLGHEIGHVALGHSKAQFQLAYATQAAREAAAASGNQTVSSLSQSQLGDLAEAVIHAQYSQSDESQADDYSYDLLKKRGVSRDGLVTAFEKLAQLSGSSGGTMEKIMSSHPPSAQRAQHIRERMAEDAK